MVDTIFILNNRKILVFYIFYVYQILLLLAKSISLKLYASYYFRGYNLLNSLALFKVILEFPKESMSMYTNLIIMLYPK